MKSLYLLMLILWECAVSTWDAIWYHRDQAQRDAEEFENHGHE